MNAKLIAVIFSLALCALHSPAAQYSKLGIITAAKDRGRWDALKSWISQSGYEDEWNAASFLSDDYPAFAAITNAICATGTATPDDVAAILAASVDTAPDALLVAMYKRDIATNDGRVKWHGRRVGYAEDTNTLTVVETYADGWQFSQSFEVKKPKSLEARLVAAKAAKRKTREATMPPGLVAVQEQRDHTAATTNEVTVAITP